MGYFLSPKNEREEEENGWTKKGKGGFALPPGTPMLRRTGDFIRIQDFGWSMKGEFHKTIESFCPLSRSLCSIIFFAGGVHLLHALPNRWKGARQWVPSQERSS